LRVIAGESPVPLFNLFSERSFAMKKSLRDNAPAFSDSHFSLAAK